MDASDDEMVRAYDPIRRESNTDCNVDYLKDLRRNNVYTGESKGGARTDFALLTWCALL